MTLMRALVTGGCGFIGSNLVHLLVSKGWKVDIIDDLSAGSIEFLEGLRIRSILGGLLPQYESLYEHARSRDTVVVVQGDIEDPNILSRIERGLYDTVFHLAANPRVTFSVEHPATTFDINVTRTARLVESIRKSPSHVRLVFSSTSAVYGNVEMLPTPEAHPADPQSPYGLQKLTVEHFLRQSHRLWGLDAVSLRYANVYGPRQLGGGAYSTAISAWCNATVSGNPLRSDGDGEQTRDMVFVTDVARANLLAARREESFAGQVINIGTGTRVSNNTILEHFRHRKPDIQVQAAPARLGDIRDTQLDITTAWQEIAWTPQVSLEDGLARTWEWWGL